MVPLKIPTPTPAPDRGGPVACQGGARYEETKPRKKTWIWGLMCSKGQFSTMN